MRPLGILGGMSWESTQHLYALINRGVAARLGGLHSARLILHSVDFAPIAAMQAAGDWAAAAQVLGEAGAGLRQAGAEALLIATNTMHLVATDVERTAGLPVLHIVDATGEALRAARVQRVGLLATRFTMEQAFYRERLRERFGIEAIVPDAAGRAEVHRVIYEELCRGRFEPASRELLRAQVVRWPSGARRLPCWVAPSWACCCPPAALPPCHCSTAPSCMPRRRWPGC
jgi:aspartate racemase